MEDTQVKKAACTIVSMNYLPFARTVCESFKRQNPGIPFFLLLVDRVPQGFNLACESFELIQVESLPIPQFLDKAFMFDILELNTNVKPTFLKHLFGMGFDQVVYLDPDIFVFESLQPIYDLLSTNSIVLTPHVTSPATVENRPSEHQFLLSGAYNLGFVAVSNSPQALAFLHWWEDRCLALGFYDTRSGLFVDQKWVDLVPSLFGRVCIFKHKGCNVAAWNLYERSISSVAGKYWINEEELLLFYHFSGVDMNSDGFASRKTIKPIPVERGSALEDILHFYKERVRANSLPAELSVRYAFGFFSDGTPVSTMARRIYVSHKHLPGGDPFDASQSFYKFAKAHRLIGAVDTSQKYSALNYQKSDARLVVIHKICRIALRILGNDRYTMLMKYLSHLSLLRNQYIIFEGAQS